MLSQLVATALIEFCLDSTFPSNVRKAMCLFICSDYKCVFFSHSRNSKDWHWINRQDTTKGWILCANVWVKNNQIYVLHFEMYTYEPDVDFKHLYILSIMLVYFFYIYTWYFKKFTYSVKHHVGFLWILSLIVS